MVFRIPGETYYDGQGRPFVEPERTGLAPDLDAAHLEYTQLLAENARLRECLEGVVWQFGHSFERDGQAYLGTMGLSNLEDAFEVLGWEEPHPYDPASMTVRFRAEPADERYGT